MNRITIIALSCLITVSNSLYADGSTLNCSNVPASLFNSPIKESPFFVLAAQGHYYSYLVDHEFFMMRCELRSDGKELLLFNNICGGTACPESNYGIVDLTNGNLLLDPSSNNFSGNDGRASEILGHPVKPFSCEKFSQTSFGAEGAQGEFCFVSPLELG